MTPDNAQMGTDIGKPTDTLIDPYGRRVVICAYRLPTDVISAVSIAWQKK